MKSQYLHFLRSKASLTYFSLSFSLVFAFQNCGRSFTPMDGSISGSSYCSINSNDASCLEPGQLQCSFHGRILQHGESTSAYLNSTVPYGQICVGEMRTCRQGVLSGSYNFQSCIPDQPASCLFDGVTYPSGSTVRAYLTSTVPFDSSCQSQMQTCTNGAWSGSYAYSSCRPNAPATCLFDGRTITHGDSIVAYETSSVPFGATCEIKTRTCYNGALTGSGEYASCNPVPAVACSFNGITIESGNSVRAYLSAAESFGGSCQSQMRTCTNGILSGSYGFPDCNVNPPSSCSFNGQVIAHGNSVPAFAAPSVPYGTTCQSQNRTCNNGILSGSGDYSVCSVTPGAACLFAGRTINSGETVSAFTSSTVPFGVTCQMQARTCINGTLSGQGDYDSCQPLAPQSCLINGQTIPHGGSITRYVHKVVAANEICATQARVCNNGLLSGSATETSCFVTPQSIANPVGLNALIASNPAYLDYAIQDVCTDSFGNIVHGDPAYCSPKRNVRIGERVPYIVTDVDTRNGNARYQALFSYPAVGMDGLIKVMVSKNMQGGFSSAFSYSFSDARDGYDLLDVDGGFVSAIRTTDPGCFDQLISYNTSQRRHGWVFYASDLGSSSSNHDIRIDRISPSIPSACARVSQDTSGSTRDIWNPPTPMTFESGKTLSTVVTYHFAHYNLSLTNNALERFFFTREYGFTRWEAWIPQRRCYDESKWYCNDPSAYLGGRCAGSGITEWGGQNWVRVDCRDSTAYIDLVNAAFPLTDVMGRSNGVIDINYSATLSP